MKKEMRGFHEDLQFEMMCAGGTSEFAESGAQ